MKKHLIYTNDYSYYRDIAIEELQYNNIEVSQENIDDETYFLMDEYLQNEKDNLNYSTDIIAIADIGLWNKRVKGYKLLKNLNQIFDITEDYNRYYVEGVTLKADCIHHDGTNHVSFYVIDLSKNGVQDFLDDIYYQRKISKSRFYKCCKSVGKLVKKIYGFWKGGV